MLKLARYVGVNTDFLTAQAFIFPKSQAAPSQTPTLALIISASGEDVFTKVRQIAPLAEETFYSSDDPIPQKILNTLNSLKEALSNVEDLQILIVALKENILYINSRGFHKLFILRDQKLTEVTASSPSDQLISGFINSGDKLLLINAKLDPAETDKQNLIWDPKIINSLINSSTDALEEEAQALFVDSAHPDPVAIILVESLEEEKVEEKISENELKAAPADFPGLDSQIDTSKKRFSLPKFNLSSLTVLKRLIPANRKAKLWALGGLAALIVIAITSIISLQKSYSQNQAHSVLLNQAREKLVIAEAAKDSDSDLSKKSLEESKNLVIQVLKDNPKNKDAKDLFEQINQKSSEILKIYQITDPPVFLSLDLIKDGFNSQKLSFSLGKVLLLDETQKTLVLIDLKDKNNQILSGPLQLGNAKFASLNGSQALIYSEDKGVLKIDTQSKNITTVAKVDQEWGRIDDIFGFGSNVYLLDTFKNQIWKYSPTQSSYTDKVNYIKDNSNKDLAGGKKLAIDYSVWVLTPGPNIQKFTGGVSDFYSPAGLDTPLKELKSIFPTEEADSIYLLDSENKRIVVTKKNGVYLAQYQGDKLQTATDFAADEENKLIYILEGAKIYQIELK
ncbi:MAG: hypothetical protein ACD_30C00013G0005 [uncultured bacterium]|uniref:Uncharacterized protein n=2 Tax=Candidatus Daviesiibacteriota TaxID=1752718 RepID=A0A0G0EPG8_9BACT|nr:MAG: hypothetical protein ACD_30C00013G0005 [uncultured bacterium]KKQ08898.1 MAG: hypothetical protein US19_C0018G0015 [Candidatus Daviesbacteria bacterium GW2011_GWB1_36_5]OGE32773.1 MAG: hypothetical protein A3C99_03620 [Candidatus Daviesbacteria bacterium RIFCSPHIGHO2_02_FULL_37_9]OGE34885.1 MAG: hypothetical protein A3E66_04740 [Candidatus Daviesbacteria bacterium RIFCSPHIGHO2_12_FULL_37_16]